MSGLVINCEMMQYACTDNIGEFGTQRYCSLDKQKRLRNGYNR